MYGIHTMDGYARVSSKPIRQSYTDMLAYPCLWEFSLNHNHNYAKCSELPQLGKYEFNLSDKGTCPSPRTKNYLYLLGIEREFTCTGVFKSLKVLQL